MTLYIKSFNRPYFLDRCLHSIGRFATGVTEIVVLDDGTPPEYLQRIQEKYPHAEIRKSEFYETKSTMIREGKTDRSKLKFPGEFWYREAMRGSDYFLLLEDDIQFTQPVDLAGIQSFMEQQALVVFKLFWLTGRWMNQGRLETADGYQILSDGGKPEPAKFEKIIAQPPLTARLMNRLTGKDYYFRRYILPYYSYYVVAGCVFRKDYFSALWKDANTLAEKVQIRRMLQFFEQNQMPLRIGKLPEEALSTSFLSSATNEFPGVPLPIFELNHRLNEAWLSGQLDALENFPQDFSLGYFQSFLPEEMRPAHRQWMEAFKKPFREFGCAAAMD